MKKRQYAYQTYVVMIEHYETEIPKLADDDPKKKIFIERLDEYRIIVAEWDTPGSGSNASRVIRGTAEAPGGARTWIDDWYEKAKAHLAVHKSGETANGVERLRIRLHEHAPLEDLASETRVKIVRRDSDTQAHSDVILPAAPRARLIRLIQAGA